MKRIIFFLIVAFALSTNCNIYAENGFENNTLADSEIEAEVDIDEDDVFGDIDTILDPDNHELEVKVSKILENHLFHPIVRFFKNLIERITRLINRIFEFATRVAVIEVK